MALCGISTETFFRLWTRAPRTRSVSWFSWPGAASEKVSYFAKRKPRQSVQHARSKLQIILRHETRGKSRFCQGCTTSELGQKFDKVWSGVFFPYLTGYYVC